MAHFYKSTEALSPYAFHVQHFAHKNLLRGTTQPIGVALAPVATAALLIASVVFACQALAYEDDCPKVLALDKARFCAIAAGINLLSTLAYAVQIVAMPLIGTGFAITSIWNRKYSEGLSEFLTGLAYSLLFATAIFLVKHLIKYDVRDPT